MKQLPAQANTQNLGHNQRDFISALHDHRRWTDRAGWAWGTDWETEKMCQALRKRGLVAVVATKPSGQSVYALSRDGVAFLSKERGNENPAARKDDFHHVGYDFLGDKAPAEFRLPCM